MAPVQRDAFVAEHWPHAPPDWQAGVAPLPHSPSPAHARHVCVATLHTGVAPPQSLSARHVTHVPAVVKQTGVAPAQRDMLPAEHWPHAPLGWQAGVAPAPHSPSPAHARHVCVAVLHTGAVPPHCALVTHGTHVADGTSHAGVAPEHRLALVAEQTPHAPLGWQAGVAPPQSLSPPHARQVCVVRLHTGVAPPQPALAMQPTHTPGPMSHAGVAPVHRLLSLAEHWPHAPPGWHAGVAPPHSPSPPQARQTWVATLHTGVVPPHCASDKQGTQAPAAA